jgi:hypothetical protein
MIHPKTIVHKFRGHRQGTIQFSAEKISSNIFSSEKLLLGILRPDCHESVAHLHDFTPFLDEIKFHMNRSDKNNERYVIPMHRKNF